MSTQPDQPAPPTPAPAAQTPAPQFVPAEHEGVIRDRWEAAKAFHADPERVLRGEAEPFCILIPPPNVTAALHLGHALNNTLQDILARNARMRGFETLWMPGTDHAGIATQAVVEKRVQKEENKRRKDFTREAFVEKIQAFKDEYEAVITNQLKMMGCSCDWDRQRFTMDPQCARAVSEAFFRLFKDGLIYRGKRLVNWDPALQTAVADDECYEQDVEGAFYYLRYPLVHAGTQDAAIATGGRDSVDPVPVTWGELARRGYPGANDHGADEEAWVTVATTRPETYLADTAVGVNPHDPRARGLRGLFVELPLVGRIIPIVEDSYVVLPKAIAEQLERDEEANDPKAGMATGFLKVTPGHDANDYEIGRRHGLSVVNMMSPDGRVSNEHDWDGREIPHNLLGKKMAEARKHVVEEFKTRGWLESVKPHKHSLKHSDRSKAVIEPYLSDQWYVKVTDPRMAQAANEVLSRGAGFQPARQPVPVTDERIHKSERRLPHWQKGGSTYFVTYRVQKGSLSESERRSVIDAWSHFDGDRYEVHALAAMPDHVHLLLSPYLKGRGEWHSLSDILHSIKRHSSLVINKARGVEGKLWQEESFDHIIRGADDYFEKLEYILGNPVTAGLAQEWKNYPYMHVTEEGRGGRLKQPDRVRGTDWKNQGAAIGKVENLPHAAGVGAAAGQVENLPHAAGVGAAAGQVENLPHVVENTVTFHPARYAKTYEQWHDNIRDWCISRQLWWGHQIPVWSGRAMIAEQAWSQLEAWEKAARLAIQGKQVTGSHERIATDVYIAPASVEDGEVVSFLERAGFTRDPDVLDTWFSSALWPLSTMGWPDDTALLKAFNPTTTLCTAREIITLWVSRMVMFNRYFLGEGQGRGPVPFRDVVIHAVIQDGEGRKMSKSLGNGIDPLEIIESHGSDAMRFTLTHMTTQTQDVRLPVEKDSKTGRNTSKKFDLGRSLVNKLWNATTGVALRNMPEPRTPAPTTPVDLKALGTVDRWLLSRLEATVRAVDEAIATYDYSGYAVALYDFIYRDLCDWYLEAVKPTLKNDPAQQAVLAHSINTVLRLAHPAMPYITEALWVHVTDLPVAPISELGLGPSCKGGLLCTAGWPTAAVSLRDPAAEAEFERLRTFVTAVREVRSEHKVPFKRRITAHIPADLAAELAAGAGADALSWVHNLAGIGTVRADNVEAATAAARIRVLDRDIALSDLADAVDAGAESDRKAKRVSELVREIDIIKARLGNPGYVQRAPAKLVEESTSALKKLQDELDSLR